MYMYLSKVLHDIDTTPYRQMHHNTFIHHGLGLNLGGAQLTPLWQQLTHKQDERAWHGIVQSRREREREVHFLKPDTASYIHSHDSRINSFTTVNTVERPHQCQNKLTFSLPLV